MKTYSAKPAQVPSSWYVIDATGLTLGRLATFVADRLRGKHKPEFTPHVVTGDFIIILNADKVIVTGRKAQQKKYYHHTQYPGGIREITFEKLLEKAPERIIRFAVSGMLPKNKLRKIFLKNLKIYVGTEHPHIAQQPETLELEKVG